MSSIRASPELLARLHEAAPPGVSLSRVIAWLLEASEGPKSIREQIEREGRRSVARAQVARLRNKGHRSVVLDEGHQEGLAMAADGWTRSLEEKGVRIHDPHRRSLFLKQGRLRRRSDATPIRMRRATIG